MTVTSPMSGTSPRPASGVAVFGVAALFVGVLALGCTGVVSKPNEGSGSGGDGSGMGGTTGPKPTDTGIIDNGVGGAATGGGGNSGTVAACTPGNPPPTTRLFRLTHTQYDNTIRALTGLDVHPSTDFPADQNQAGFDRGMDLQVGDALGKAYQASAETLAAKIVATPAAFTKVVTCDPAGGDTCARAFIADFGLRLYRRPLSADEVSSLVAAFATGPMLVDGTLDDFHKGTQVVLEAMLQSPNFLYRVELSTQQSAGLVPLGGYELASRLALFMSNGPPDGPLLDAAANGQLATADAVVAQARRLVGSDGNKDTVRDFHHQWLLMDTYANKLTKDTTKYPTVTPDLATTLIAETESFVGEVTYGRGKGFTSLLTAPFTFVNKTTAPLYGVSGTFGDALQRVDLDSAKRAGLFTQVGFLATRAYSNQSSPIHRGAFIQRNVLCAKIPDPPPNVPKLPALMATQTTRQQVDMHTAPAECAGCHHVLINPVGFGLENYDAVGTYRTMENGAPIDATGTLAGTRDNVAFTDGVSESAALAAAPEARACYATTWVRYAFGRAETTGDSCAVSALAANLGDDNYTITDLMVDLTRTKAFMFRSPGAP